MHITGLSFLIFLVLPFIFLPPIWAVLSLVFVSLVSPVLSLVILIVLELLRVPVNKQSPNFGFVIGVIESLILIFFSRTITHIPTNFLFITAAIYLVNQLGRTFRYGYTFDPFEIKQLVGFAVTLLANTVL